MIFPRRLHGPPKVGRTTDSAGGDPLALQRCFSVHLLFASNLHLILPRCDDYEVWWSFPVVPLEYVLNANDDQDDDKTE